jgi:hypothetical protein
MRKLTLTHVLLALMCAGVLVAVTGAGCNSVNQSGYRAVGAAHVTVHAAMSAWNEYVKLKHPPASQELAVKAAFEKWQRAMLVVCDAGKAQAQAIAAAAQTNGVISIVSNFLQQAVADAAQDQADLVGLIQSFGVKLS